MTTRILWNVALLLLCFFAAGTLTAQSETEMAEVFSWRFQTDAPDNSFRKMEDADGWEAPDTQSNLVGMAMPVSYERMLADLEALHSEEGQKIIEQKPLSLNDIDGHLVILELAPLAGLDTVVFYSLMYIRPYRGFTLVLTAQYPKSLHPDLYDKMVRSFGTVRQIEE
ncbi:MAG: hypothetical protein EP344_10160 [Bacteroidetes bacterium]|nr:MAG: hypothetical protein EP344_10160 [Bacteroidota bacterium]